MNILRINNSNIKIVALIVVIFLLTVIGLWSHFKRAWGAEGDPEAQMQNLLGEERTSFSVDESGYLNLKAYSEVIPDFVEQLDIVLAIDVSGSMKRIIPGTNPPITKLTRAKNFAKEFIDQVGINDEVFLSILKIDSETIAADATALTALDSISAKNTKKTAVQNLTEEGGGTDISGAVSLSNNILSNGRAGATKYIILLTDMGENGPYSGGKQTFLNGFEFTSNDPAYVANWTRNWIADMNAGVVPGSILANTIAQKIKIVGIYINPNGSVNDLTVPASNPDAGAPEGGYSGIQYGNAGLMRFVTAKTNGIIPSESTDRWNIDFTSEENLDNKYFYLFYDDIINSIYQYIRGNTGVELGYFLKIAPQTELESVYSAKDKGGVTRSVELEEISSGYYKIKTSLIPATYQCFHDDLTCQSNAVMHEDGTYWIENNYLDIKIKTKFTSVGTFDLLTNYIGCESGPLKQISQDSRVEYYDPRDGSKYKNLYFKSVCIRVSESSPFIIKTSYGSDPGEDLINPKGSRQASFDAGDDVWIVLEIDDSTSGRSDFIIEDKVPESVSGKVEYSFYHGGSKIKTGEASVTDAKLQFSGQNSEGSETIGALAGGKNFIKYKIKI